MHDADGAGALRVVTAIDDAALAGLGFRPVPGGLVLHTDAQEQLRAVRGAGPPGC